MNRDVLHSFQTLIESNVCQRRCKETTSRMVNNQMFSLVNVNDNNFLTWYFIRILTMLLLKWGKARLCKFYDERKCGIWTYQHFKYNLCWVVMMGYRVHRVPYELLLRKTLHVLSSIPRHDVYWYKEINIDTGVYLSAPV